MATATTVNIEHRFNWIGKLVIYATKRGIRLPRPVVRWMCERSVQIRIDGGPWRTIKTDLSAEVSS